MIATSPRARSEHQDVGTPRILLDAIEQRFGKITFDLAATRSNAVCGDYYDPEENSFEREWPSDGILWLNPPFADIDPWAAKCPAWHGEPSALLLLVVPASVDARWWERHVSGKARCLALAPRIVFVGSKDPYPKPIALCVFDPRWPECPRTVEPWRWRP